MDVLRFGVVDYKFGSRLMIRISKRMVQGLILVILFMMVIILLGAVVMVMMVNLSFGMVMVRHKAVDQR